MVIEKEISEYGGRKRINITKKDGLKSGEIVIVLTKEEYQHIKEALFSLQMKVDAYDSRQDIIEETIEKTLSSLGITRKSKENIELQSILM